MYTVYQQLVLPACVIDSFFSIPSSARRCLLTTTLRTCPLDAMSLLLLQLAPMCAHIYPVTRFDILVARLSMPGVQMIVYAYSMI